MDGELSTGVKILIVIVLICIIIGIVFGVFSFINSNTESSQQGMEQSVASMQASATNKYDQTEVSGSSVLSAIEYYKGQDFTIVVQNLKDMGGTPVKGGNAASSVYGMGITGFTAAGTEQYAKIDALDPAATPSPTGPFFGNNMALAKDQSTTQFIRNTAKYDSFLIKDSGQQVVGVYFVQVR